MYLFRNVQKFFSCKVLGTFQTGTIVRGHLFINILSVLYADNPGADSDNLKGGVPE